MDWMTLFIQAVAGALGGNIGGQINKPPHVETGAVLSTILGVIGGLLAGHFAGGAAGELMNNATLGQAAIAGVAGFVVLFVFNIVRKKKTITL